MSRRDNTSVKKKKTFSHAIRRVTWPPPYLGCLTLLSLKAPFSTWMTAHTGVRGRSCGCDALWLHTEAGGGGGRRRWAHLSPPHLSQLKAAAGMEPAVAYGAAKAGSVSFDPVAFFKHPRTILRLLCWVSLLCNAALALMSRPACSRISVWLSGSFSAARTVRNDYLFAVYETRGCVSDRCYKQE